MYFNFEMDRTDVKFGITSGRVWTSENRKRFSEPVVTRKRRGFRRPGGNVRSSCENTRFPGANEMCSHRRYLSSAKLLKPAENRPTWAYVPTSKSSRHGTIFFYARLRFAAASTDGRTCGWIGRGDVCRMK